MSTLALIAVNAVIGAAGILLLGQSLVSANKRGVRLSAHRVWIPKSVLSQRELILNRTGFLVATCSILSSIALIWHINQQVWSA